MFKEFEKKHVEAAGHFGTYADKDGKPQLNENYKSKYNDILGVVYDLKPTSVSSTPNNMLKYNEGDNQEMKKKKAVLKLAHDNNVYYITFKSFGFKPIGIIESAVYFKLKNIRKAVFIGLLHTTQKISDNANTTYIVGKLFGYPDKDMEVYLYPGKVLPEKWDDLSTEEKTKIWNNPETKKKIKIAHKEYLKNKKKDDKILKKILKSDLITNEINRLKLENAILKI